MEYPHKFPLRTSRQRFLQPSHSRMWEASVPLRLRDLFFQQPAYQYTLSSATQDLGYDLRIKNHFVVLNASVVIMLPVYA